MHSQNFDTKMETILSTVKEGAEGYTLRQLIKLYSNNIIRK